MTKTVVTLTLNPTIDKSSSVDTVAPEIKLRCNEPSFDPGGGGINVSRAMHRLGSDATTVYTAGGGPGDMLTSLLQQESIPVQPIGVAGLTRENLTVYEEKSGVQYRFGMPGPELTAEELDSCTQAVLDSGADYVVASGSLASGVPVDYYATLAKAVRDAGAKFILDTSGDALAAIKGAGVFLLKPNLREMEILTGVRFRGEVHLREQAQGLIREGLTEVLVISMGSQGALVVTADEVVHMHPPVVPIQSKVGAGDSMVGGIMLGLSEERELLDAIRYGIAAGSAAVMTPGTQLCRKSDTDRIYEQIRLLT